MRDDDLLELLEQLDPARSEEPPAPGSSRYTAIQEQAMSKNTALVRESAPESDTDTDTHTGDTTTSTPRSRRPLGRWRFVAAAAAVVVAVGAGVVLRPGNEPSAEATIVAAAEELAEVTSLRADMHVDNVAFGVGEITIEVSGYDSETVWEGSADGSPEESEQIVIVTVDNVEYRTDLTGLTTVQTVETYMDEEGASFAESSAAIVTAVLEDADIDEVGTEEVQDVEATHYRVELADAGESALAALPDRQQDWFGLIIGDGGLDRNVTVDIWVADGLVRRFDISSPDYGSQSVEFYDFNADIRVTPPPPPGPYAEPSPS